MSFKIIDWIIIPRPSPNHEIVEIEHIQEGY